jgi:hypothetical protein
MLILIAALLALACGFAPSFLMSRASNFSAAANLSFGASFVVVTLTTRGRDSWRLGRPSCPA